MARTFYIQRYVLTVLTQEPLPDPIGLEDLLYEITQGDASGELVGPETTEVDGPTMAKALESQGSDAEFFQLDADGNDLDDEAAETE